MWFGPNRAPSVWTLSWGWIVCASPHRQHNFQALIRAPEAHLPSLLLGNVWNPSFCPHQEFTKRTVFPRIKPFKVSSPCNYAIFYVEKRKIFLGFFSFYFRKRRVTSFSTEVGVNLNLNLVGVKTWKTASDFALVTIKTFSKSSVSTCHDKISFARP